MMNIWGIVFLLFLLAVFAGIILLQVYLSKQESKWPGLILPAITFVLSVVVVLSMAVYTVSGVGTATTWELIDGEWVLIEQYDIPPEIPGAGVERIPGATGRTVFIFLLMNIPTAILLVIYKAVRGRHARRRDIEKMSVQDL